MPAPSGRLQAIFILPTVDIPSKLAHFTDLIPEDQRGLIKSHDEFGHFGSEPSVVSRTLSHSAGRDAPRSMHGSDAVSAAMAKFNLRPENLSRPLLSCYHGLIVPPSFNIGFTAKERKARSPCRRDLHFGGGIPHWGQKQLLRDACIGRFLRVCVCE